MNDENCQTKKSSTQKITVAKVQSVLIYLNEVEFRCAWIAQNDTFDFLWTHLPWMKSVEWTNGFRHSHSLAAYSHVIESLFLKQKKRSNFN